VQNCLRIVTGNHYYDRGDIGLTVTGAIEGQNHYKTEVIFTADQRFYDYGETEEHCFDGVVISIICTSTSTNGYTGKFVLRQNGSKVKEGPIKIDNSHQFIYVDDSLGKILFIFDNMNRNDLVVGTVYILGGNAHFPLNHEIVLTCWRMVKYMSPFTPV